MKLYFVRHGKASQVAPSDAQRPLTEGGIESMKHIATVLKKAGIKPKKIFTSPRVRAHQTADIIGEVLGITPEINDACNFNFSANAAMKLCEDFDDEDELMFVGHNPSMSEVVEHITGAAIEMSTGAVACVTNVYPPSVSRAILKWMLTPNVIDPIFEDD